MGNSSKDGSANSGDAHHGDAQPSNSCIYSTGEKVLAYHGPRIYEAKVQKTEIRKNEWRYFVHYPADFIMNKFYAWELHLCDPSYSLEKYDS